MGSNCQHVRFVDTGSSPRPLLATSSTNQKTGKVEFSRLFCGLAFDRNQVRDTDEKWIKWKVHAKKVEIADFGFFFSTGKHGIWLLFRLK